MRVVQLTVACSLAFAATSAAAVEYRKAIHYDYLYEAANAAVYFRADDRQYTSFTAYADDLPATSYTPIFRFGFFVDGFAAMDLDGQTLDLASFFASPPGAYNALYHEGVIDHWGAPEGFLTFGNENEIVGWRIASSGEEPSEGWGYGWEHMSDAAPLATSWAPLSNTTNAAEVIGLMHYGMQYTEPGLEPWFQLAPGRWSLSVSSYCYDAKLGDSHEIDCDQVAAVPVPASGLLLLSVPAVLGLLARRPRQTRRP